jgi:hypothetical protein
MGRFSLTMPMDRSRKIVKTAREVYPGLATVLKLMESIALMSKNGPAKSGTSQVSNMTLII